MITVDLDPTLYPAPRVAAAIAAYQRLAHIVAVQVPSGAFRLQLTSEVAASDEIVSDEFLNYLVGIVALGRTDV